MNILGAITAVAGLVASLAVSPSAIARDVMWDGKPFHLPVPDGWCEIEPQAPAFEAHKKLMSGTDSLLVYALPCSKLPESRSGKPVFDTIAWTAVITENGAPVTDSAARFVPGTAGAVRRAMVEFQEAKARGDAFSRSGEGITDFQFLKSTSTAVFVLTVLNTGSEQTGKSAGLMNVEANVVIDGHVFRVQLQGLIADGATETAFVKTEEALIEATRPSGVTWQGQQFHLPLPLGWCALETEDSLFKMIKERLAATESALVYALPCSKVEAFYRGEGVFDAVKWSAMLVDGEPIPPIDDLAGFIAGTQTAMRDAMAQIRAAQVNDRDYSGGKFHVVDLRIAKTTSTTVFVSRVVRGQSHRTGELADSLSVIATTLIDGHPFQLEIVGRISDGASEAAFIKTAEALIDEVHPPQPSEVTWEGRQFHLPVPDGWCALHADDRNRLFARRKIAAARAEVQLVYAIPCSKVAEADNGASVFDGFAWGGMIGKGTPLVGLRPEARATFAKDTEAALRQAFIDIAAAQARRQTLPGNNSQVLDSRIEKSTSTAVFASRILRVPAEQNGEALEAISVIAMTVIGDSAFRLEMQGQVKDGASVADFVKAEEAQIAAAQARQP